MAFELLNPSDVRVGDLYLGIDRVPVYGILPDQTELPFSHKPLSKPKPQAVRLNTILPYVISYVDEKGFKCEDAKGETVLDQHFDRFREGIIITQRGEESRLYVTQTFLDMLAKYYGIFNH